MKLRSSTLLTCFAGSLLGCAPAAPPALRSLEVAPVTVPPPACQAPASTLRPVGPGASSVVLGRDAERTVAFVADADDRAVVAIDIDADREVARLELGSRPEQLLVAPDGRLFATLADQDKLALLHWDGAALTPTCAKDLPGEPTGMAMRGGRLAVVSRWAATLTLLDGELAVERVVPLPRDPYAVGFAADDSAVVSHVVGGTVSVVNVASGEARRLDASRTDQKVAVRSFKEALPPRQSMFRNQKKIRVRPLDSVQAHRVATQSYAVAMAPDGRAFIPASLADGSRAPRASGGYGGGSQTMRTHMGVTLAVDTSGSSVMVPFGRARSLHGDCQLPRGAAYDSEQGWLFVTCLGVDALRIYDVGSRTHDALRLEANVAPGPTGVAIDTARRRAVVWSPHSGALTVTTLPTREQAKLAVTSQVALARQRPVDPQIALGRDLFHLAGNSRRIAVDGRACASCHPDGRDDGVSWFTAEGPRQTPILMDRLAGTAPFGWNGRNEELDGHLERTLRRLQSRGLSETQRDALFAYIGSMTPPAASVDPTPELARGAALFADEEVGCASCHPTGADTTDGQTHELGPVHGRDALREFDTPSLRFVARSAPYFHDGRYATLAELLADPESEMGHSASLPPADRRALETYLHTL